jgi:hypothetical protein
MKLIETWRDLQLEEKEIEKKITGISHQLLRLSPDSTQPDEGMKLVSVSSCEDTN